MNCTLIIKNLNLPPSYSKKAINSNNFKYPSLLHKHKLYQQNTTLIILNIINLIIQRHYFSYTYDLQYTVSNQILFVPPLVHLL